MSNALGFGRDDLRRLAGARSFERGLGYLSCVSALEIGERTITATVDGTDVYGVELTEHEGGLTGWCSCPYGQEGNFCKHCVAVGLAVLQQSESVPKQRAAATSRVRQLTTWLETRSRDELLALVKEHIAADHDLRRRLELRASAAGDDPSAVRERILALLDTRPFAQYGYVEYADARSYGLQAAEAVSALRTLTETGRATDVVGLARSAIEALARTYGEIDDSDGVIGDVADGLAAAHLEACLVAHPDPAQTADWLVDHLLSDLSDATGVLLPEYADVLKAAGLSRAHERAAAALRENPEDWAAKDLMDQLLRMEGSVDALIALHAADLAPSGATHLLIAQELERAGRPAEALDWAERGLREAEPDHGPDPHLVDFACERYIRAGRSSDVVQIRREVLLRRRSLTAYQHLRTAARAAGCWEEAERTRALDALRADARPGENVGHPGSALVDALLDDGDFDAAWDAATEGYADGSQWLILADRTRDHRPADALAVYLRLIGPLLTRTGDATYERLTELLLSARACHRALDTEYEFATYMTTLRTAQKRKRKLTALLDRHGL
ncbi:SWIM zinc finger domain-containing protein [Streptomyces sp. NPDC051109]|uniref:SWIM zinc finger domain-containing protein n=1 Tax=Streptomyces sp. NPDC051109 TaxID=3365642 RepID=UPI00378EE627